MVTLGGKGLTLQDPNSFFHHHSGYNLIKIGWYRLVMVRIFAFAFANANIRMFLLLFAFAFAYTNIKNKHLHSHSYSRILEINIRLFFHSRSP